MQSYPFTSQVTYDEQGLPLYDRAVDSAFLRKVFAAYFSDGIFYKPTNALQVVASSGMQVQVQPGICHIQGAMGIEPNRRTLPLADAGSQPRIDTVVARLDLSQAVRSIELYVKGGMPAASPSAPTLTRDSTIWELGLADIAVGANVGGIPQASITDTRPDPARCGLVAQTVGELDTGPYFAQLKALIDDLRAEIAGVNTGASMLLKEVYDPDGDGVVNYAEPLYAATLLVDGWTASASGGGYTQTAACTPQDGGPALTATTQLMGPMCRPTGTQATDEALQAALSIVNRGTTTPGDGAVTVHVWERPDCDITVTWPGRG